MTSSEAPHQDDHHDDAARWGPASARAKIRARWGLSEAMERDQRREANQRGSALVEFLALAVLLLLPALWFLLGVAHIQSASYAVVGAADQAAKMHTASDVSEAERDRRSTAAAEAALADFGISSEQAQITRSCTSTCAEPGEIVGYTVEVRVPVPLIPEFGGWEHSLVTVSSTSAHTQAER